jgi:magnesium-transporting ATPase (P-type)
MVVGSTVWATEENGYGILPTFSMGVAAENQKIFISLSILCLASMLEGLILAFTLEIISGIKKEFAMQQELSIFSAIWLTTTNLALFFAVHSSFFNVEPLTYSRIIFWILLIRSLAVSIVTACVPLYETITNSDEMFFPIPPNRECIESVDMVLHIPVAVDFFYNYLQSRHEQLRDKQAIHLIALYIDLRLYDKACTDGEPTDVKYDIASEIYE